jgi:hypothetical protein
LKAEHSNDDTAPLFRRLGLASSAIPVGVALPIFAAVEYASGDRVLPWGEVSFFFGLAGAFCYGWRARKEMRE